MYKGLLEEIKERQKKRIEHYRSIQPVDVKFLQIDDIDALLSETAKLTAENERMIEALRQFPTLPPLYETKPSGVIVETEESKDPAESLDDRCHDFFSDALLWKSKYVDPALAAVKKAGKVAG